MSSDRGPHDLGPGPGEAEPVEPDLISGGMPMRPDDELYEARVARERGEITSGGSDYDPADVPPAADPEIVIDLTQTDQYLEELEEIRRQREAGELITEGSSGGFPPTRYERD